MNELISIIVPVYNVESYLTDCINSILHQTYANFELILAVNGCTDNSEQICRDFAQNDSRIKVLSLPGKGLSYARNEGLKISKGNFIAYIDSDDYVNPDYLSLMYDTLSKNDAQLCVCKYTSVEESSEYHCESFSSEDITYDIVSSKEMLNRFFHDHKTYYVTAWNKLYTRELALKLLFPIGRKCEDEYIAYKAIYYSDNVALISKSLYNYRQRSTSIMHTKGADRFVDAINAYSERTDFFISNNEPNLAGQSCSRSLYWGIIFYYSCCGYDAVNAMTLKKLIEKEYQIYINNIPSESDRKLNRLYEQFSISPIKAKKLYLKLEHKRYASKTPIGRVIVNDLRSLKNNLKFNLKCFVLTSICQKHPIANISLTDASIDALISNPKGLCRFGDGEESIISGKDIGFQKYDSVLAQKLKDILKDESANCYIGIPDELNLSDFTSQTKKSQTYWMWYIKSQRGHWKKLINPNINYLTTNVTRCYMRYWDKTQSINYFVRLRTLWDNKHIIIVEGTSSRLGIGNDLFATASIQRILCPECDAFNHYDEIFNAITKFDKSIPIFLALGPTATVLAYNLCNMGYLAYDIGHIDIEYEWMLSKTDTKIAISHKFTNEADNGNLVSACTDSDYLSQIVAKII